MGGNKSAENHVITAVTELQIVEEEMSMNLS